MKQAFIILGAIVVMLIFHSCEDSLTNHVYYFGFIGTITFTTYAAEGDTLQIVYNDSAYATYTMKNSLEYDFIKYYEKESDLDFYIINKSTTDTIHTYSFSFIDDDDQSADGIVSFYYKSNGIFIDSTSFISAGVLSDTKNDFGVRFMFPNMNYYSNSSYEGTVDVIISDNGTGDEIDTVEDVSTDAFSDFVEFPYSSATSGLVDLQIVKHGTSESYLDDGSDVIIEAWKITQAASKLFLIEETADDNGNFSGVESTLSLTTIF